MELITRQKSFRAQAIDQLREGIVTGRLAPGALLSEQVLAEMLAISRTPVREALLQLASDGLVELIPQRGVRILEIDPEHLGEVFELWAALESYCAFELAQRPTTDVVERLQFEIERQERIIATTGDCMEWAHANIDFHFCLIRALGNASMEKSLALVTTHVLRVGYRLLTRTDRMHVAVVEHKAILDAFRQRDPVAARERVIDHRDSAIATLRKQLARSNLMERSGERAAQSKPLAALTEERIEMDVDAKRNPAVVMDSDVTDPGMALPRAVARTR